MIVPLASSNGAATWIPDRIEQPPAGISVSLLLPQSASLGIGDDHYPLPWQSLKYDTNLGGYVTGITEAQLQNAPKYSNDNYGIGVIQHGPVQ